MTTHLPGEPFAVIDTFKDVDWETSTATLYPGNSTPRRVDLSRTLSAKKILQAQKRDYMVKGRVVDNFIDSSKATRVEEIEDLDTVAYATSGYESLIPLKRQARIAEYTSEEYYES